MTGCSTRATFEREDPHAPEPVQEHVFLDRYALRDCEGQLLGRSPAEMWRRLDKRVQILLLLALSRLEAGVALEREPHRFADLVGTTLHQLRPALKGRDVVLEIPRAPDRDVSLAPEA